VSVSEAKRPLVEIVPNFSEGRRQDVIDAIIDALMVPGVTLLNKQWDPDHNRLDASLAGSPESVKRSALAGAAKAAELIDMTQHQGSHPRMGAVDVIPFLPIRDVTMEECVALAREVARDIGEGLGIPAYCYEQAAFTPERRNLAGVRKGEYEGLKADVAAGNRLPDFGPHELGRAGAVAVGARKPLVAFNMYLAGTDEKAAKDIARQVREATGGLKNVRAIGFFVPERGCLTVSMNLVDTDATPIYRAFELVKLEASRFGLPVISSEIVGLVPQATIAESAAFWLQLEGFDPEEQVLETVVQRATEEVETADEDAGIAGQTVGGFLDALASDAPTPGGGTASALTAAIGASLVAMVTRLTIGKKGFQEVGDRMGQIAVEADAARIEFESLADHDARAFDAVMQAYRLPKVTDEEKQARSEAIQRAMTEATDVPAGVARRAVAILELAREVTETGNPNTASDGAVAAHILRGAVEGALANVEINLASLNDADMVIQLRTDVELLRRQSEEALRGTAAAFHQRR
jgi:glutamate formiminotransferase / formiminotetrahydrofolate cyclodeaminase